MAAWRRGTVRLVSLATRPNVTVVVPMSVLRTAYLDELLVGLQERGHDVHHVLLDASVDALHARIASDQAEPSAAGWRRRHVDVYQEARPALAARGITVDTTGANARASPARSQPNFRDVDAVDHVVLTHRHATKHPWRWWTQFSGGRRPCVLGA